MAGSRLAGGHHGVTRSGLDAVRRWADGGAVGRRRKVRAEHNSAIGTGAGEYSAACILAVMEAATPSDVLARFGHALSDPTRARILLALREASSHPSDLADHVGASRQSVSNHLACLRGCGLVVAVPEGRRTRYELADRNIGLALGDLLSLVLAVDPTCSPVDVCEKVDR